MSKVVSLSTGYNPLSVFYSQYTTLVLTRVRAGLERYYDLASTDPDEARYWPSDDWLTERMHVIDQILSNRSAEQDQVPRGLTRAWDEVEEGKAKSVKRWNR